MKHYVINFIINFIRLIRWVLCFLISFVVTTALLRAVYLYRLLPTKMWLKIIFPLINHI